MARISPAKVKGARFSPLILVVRFDRRGSDLPTDNIHQYALLPSAEDENALAGGHIGRTAPYSPKPIHIQFWTKNKKPFFPDDVTLGTHSTALRCNSNHPSVACVKELQCIIARPLLYFDKLVDEIIEFKQLAFRLKQDADFSIGIPAPASQERFISLSERDDVGGVKRRNVQGHFQSRIRAGMNRLTVTSRTLYRARQAGVFIWSAI